MTSYTSDQSPSTSLPSMVLSQCSTQSPSARSLITAQRRILHSPCEIGGIITGLDRDRSACGLGGLGSRIRLEDVLAEGYDPGDAAHADLGLA